MNTQQYLNMVKKVPHCDNCAGNLPVLPHHAIVWNEAVVLCSTSCLYRLHRVWCPGTMRYSRVFASVNLAVAVCLTWLFF